MDRDTIRRNGDRIRHLVQHWSEKVHGDPHRVEILPVTKYLPVESMPLLYEAGYRVFGENRVQDLLRKREYLESLYPGECRFDLIGPLQSNKVNKVVGKIRLFQAFDRLDLIPHFQKQDRTGAPLEVLLEIQWEQQKHGFRPEEVVVAISQITNCSHIKIMGLMVMAPDTDNQGEIARCFERCRLLYEEIGRHPREGVAMRILSMGMSQDFELAIREGATLVRIGRALYEP